MPDTRLQPTWCRCSCYPSSARVRRSLPDRCRCRLRFRHLHNARDRQGARPPAARIGILLALAEAAEQRSVGLALAGELTHSGVARFRVILIVSGLGSLVFVTAILGATVLSRLTGGAMEIVLSFGLAALLYLVTDELLREAHPLCFRK